MDTRGQIAYRLRLATQDVKEILRRGPQARKIAITWLPWLAGGWALFYALYRGYYALGGTFGMTGIPVSWSQWRLINGVGAIALLLAAVFPVVTIPLWRYPRARMWLLAIGWVIAVCCIMHALIDETIRLLSVAGALHKDYPFFVPGSRDYHAADLEDIFFNEPWFLLEGLLWGALCWAHLATGRERRWWLASALIAILLLTVIGLLSSFGVIGTFIIF